MVEVPEFSYGIECEIVKRPHPKYGDYCWEFHHTLINHKTHYYPFNLIDGIKCKFEVTELKKTTTKTFNTNDNFHNIKSYEGIISPSEHIFTISLGEEPIINFGLSIFNKPKEPKPSLNKNSICTITQDRELPCDFRFNLELDDKKFNDLENSFDNNLLESIVFEFDFTGTMVFVHKDQIFNLKMINHLKEYYQDIPEGFPHGNNNVVNDFNFTTTLKLMEHSTSKNKLQSLSKLILD